MQPAHLAIFGPGLIGGSLALAIRQHQLCGRLSVWSPSAAERRQAEQRGLADLVTGDVAEAVAEADLVILCTPPAALSDLGRQIAAHLEENATVTDVASVKGSVVGELTAIFQRADANSGSRYVGGHPMAGGENHGLDSARAGLFEGCVCLLTPLDGQTSPRAIERVESFWRALGARVQRMSPEAHDRAVAAVSHLPHLLAAALVNHVDGADEALTCAGPGWRDMTRLAGGSPEMWTEILSRNRPPVTTALRGMVERLCEVLEVLETGRDTDLEAFLEQARSQRQKAEGKRQKAK